MSTFSQQLNLTPATYTFNHRSYAFDPDIFKPTPLKKGVISTIKSLCEAHLTKKTETILTRAEAAAINDKLMENEIIIANIESQILKVSEKINELADLKVTIKKLKDDELKAKEKMRTAETFAGFSPFVSAGLVLGSVATAFAMVPSAIPVSLFVSAGMTTIWARNALKKFQILGTLTPKEKSSNAPQNTQESTPQNNEMASEIENNLDEIEKKIENAARYQAIASLLSSYDENVQKYNALIKVFETVEKAFIRKKTRETELRNSINSCTVMGIIGSSGIEPVQSIIKGAAQKVASGATSIVSFLGARTSSEIDDSQSASPGTPRKERTTKKRKTSNT